MKVTPSNRGVSDYVLTLAHDPESLAVRSPLFNGIMYGRGGLSRAERELGAVGASVVNRCIYCAAVHAERYIQLTKRAEVIDAVFAGEVQATLDPDAQPVFDFAVALSKTPPAATPDMVRSLRARGKNDTEILDLILSVGIFGWANRLMHTLGEPVAE
jgi:uncharacterized peroxidase-related enzyme